MARRHAHNHRRSLLLAVLALPTFAYSDALPAADARPPNIVFILADDLGYRELGCFGQERIRTPRIDELARGGLRLTQHYSGNAVCAPSRCVLLTGKHPGHAAIRDNKEMQPEGQWPIAPNDVTLAELLRDAGYTTGVFGKWGLGGPGSTGEPLSQGFDRFFGYNCQYVAHSYYPPSLWSDRDIFPLANNPAIPGHASLAEGAVPTDPRNYAAFEGTDYAPDRIHEQALRFLHENHERPFFLCYTSTLPHLALHVPASDLAQYHALGWNDPPFIRAKSGYTPHFTPRAAYAAMISHLDTQVGSLLDTLDELGLAADTLVVFSSDNGATHVNDEVDVEFFRSVGELRGLKGSLYEGGVRVPTIVRWPGRIAPGGESDFVSGFEDWLPTFLEAASITAPDDCDGISLIPTLTGESQPEREFLYREFPGYGGQQSLRAGPWKLVRQNLKRDGARSELYHLLDDPSEQHDVAADHPDVVARLESLARRAHVPSMDFPLPALDQLAAENIPGAP
jgi:arylsulfatase A